MCHPWFFTTVGVLLCLTVQYAYAYLSQDPDEAERGHVTFDEVRKMLRYVGQYGYNPKKVETLFNVPAEKHGVTCLKCEKAARWFKLGPNGNLDEFDYEYAPLREAPSPYEMIAKFARYHVPKDLAKSFAAIFKSERLHPLYVDDTYAVVADMEREKAEAAAAAEAIKKEKEERIAAEIRREEEIARKEKLERRPEVQIPEVEGVPVYVETSYRIKPARKAPPPPTPTPLAPPASLHIPIRTVEKKIGSFGDDEDDSVPFPIVIRDTRANRDRCDSDDSEVTISPAWSITKKMRRAHRAGLSAKLLGSRRKTNSL